jgi:hypothetical protein
MIDAEKLREMRAFAAEVREDLAMRELAAEEDHAQIMATTAATRASPAMIYKVKPDARVRRQVIDEPGDSTDDVPPFSDEQVDVVAQVIADLRTEMRGDCQAMIDAALAPLRERIASIEGSLSTLIDLLGNNGGRSVEASEVRKLSVLR